jgi:hypothetical protein
VFQQSAGLLAFLDEGTPALLGPDPAEQKNRVIAEQSPWGYGRIAIIPERLVEQNQAILVATVLDTTARLTDDIIVLFDRAVGRLLRRAEVREEEAVLRNARSVNDKVRLFTQLGEALLAARDAKQDPLQAVETAVGWDRLARSVEEARRLVRPNELDFVALTARAWPVLHRLAPLFLNALHFRGLPAAAGTVRAVETLQAIYRSNNKDWPSSLPVAFLRLGWRKAVLSEDKANRRIWEVATLLALRDRLRAGDIWVEGSRQWRAVEDQLITPDVFQSMRHSGPLPVAVPETARAWLDERRELLARRLTESTAVPHVVTSKRCALQGAS